MANLVITAANVVPGAGAILNNNFVAGETITQGMPVYLNTSTQKWMKALANGTAIQSGIGTTLGVSINAASLNQNITVQTAGSYTVGATVALGTAYGLSETAGDLCPLADIVTTGDYFSWMIYPTSTTVATILPFSSGSQHA